jgi:hypothetical protein
MPRAEHKTNPLLKFLGYFWGPIPWMIEIAVISDRIKLLAYRILDPAKKGTKLSNPTPDLTPSVSARQ